MLRLILKSTRFLVLLAAVFVFVSFAVENKDKTSLSLFPIPFNVEIAKYALILASFGAGYIFAIMHGIIMVRRQKSLIREYRTRANSLENEIKKLKAASAESTAPVA